MGTQTVIETENGFIGDPGSFGIGRPIDWKPIVGGVVDTP